MNSFFALPYVRVTFQIISLSSLNYLRFSYLLSFTGFSQGAVFKAMIVFLLAASTHSRPQVKRDIAAHAEPVAWHDTEEDDIPNTFTKRDVDDHTDSLDLDDC